MLFSLPFHNSSKDLRTTVKFKMIYRLGQRVTFRGKSLEERFSKAFVGQKVIQFIPKRSKPYYEQITISSILPWV